MNVFVSYSRRDLDFALRLVKALRDWGHNPWIDIEKIDKGANWPGEIDKGLDAAEVVIGVLSENSMASGMVKNEWDYALVNEKPLIPVRLHPCKISHRYVRINYVDCASDECTGFDLLCKALHSPKTLYNDSAAEPKPDKSKAVESPKQRVTNRATMLNKVHDFWIKGVLEPAKLGDVWLDLPAEQRPEAVQPEVKRDLHSPDFDSFSLGSGAKIVDVFRRMGNEVLILGAPGSGKTMTLLELARDLIAQAQAHSDQPIPVVLNLSSWAEKHPDKLEDWLVERLFLDYGVPRKLDNSWIENGILLFLFDGLDEVAEAYRDACVTAINTFWRKYDQVDNGIAVCSRIADYKKLTMSLHLENAILLDTLTPAQADDYLGKLGEGWDELRAAIPNDTVLRTFAESPLLLNIMAVAYRDIPREHIVGLSETNQKRQLFDRYVARRLREDKAPEKYPNAKTRHYLCWLAKKMVQHQQIVFQIERLQPDWLDAERQRQQYRREKRWLPRLVGGLVGGLLGLLVGGLLSGLGGLLVGLLVSGLLGGLGGWLSGSLDARDLVSSTDRLSWSWQATGGLGAILIVGLGMGMAGAMVGELVDRDRGLLVGGLLCLLFSVLFGGLTSSTME